ncbi:hypothetical protein CVD25_04230 [Bacillus canaveralius]|uniref:LysM domain-containing protein n=1 Tax=Bacillus canaveralius TaxID=1403243 RepID=A0A2N5GR57_9BACI|nr:MULTISPECIES: hypothetical protein [Bacillus]PLR85932.1 hypothetical protein CU635_02520 [Bacillus canaveralius]PLR87607.1 hypothetical protein CVD23_01680 [Bacillus sp. V33-4]PLS00051.1 hypothetical protein CVD25_04230 [Bacillus canaveralius]RSK56212.1 hypothetical protein EJA13_02320 [Bacillus canaveralius]
MKRIAGFICVVLVIYVIYFDLSSGTLPGVKEKKIEAKMETQLAYFESSVKPGDTVLSIIEKNIDKAVPVSIEQVITDFQSLNEGLKPTEIQIGEDYKFPEY